MMVAWTISGASGETNEHRIDALPCSPTLEA